MSDSQNKKWKTYCRTTGNEISFADFCELENRYASERISKQEVTGVKFHNDHGPAAAAAVSQETEVIKHPASVKNEEEEDEKILGMPRNVAIGVFILLAVLALATGIYFFVYRKKDVTMPGAVGAVQGNETGTPAPAVAV